MENKSSRNVQGATGSGPRPGEFPLGSEKSRAAARAVLEARTEPRKVLRPIVSRLGGDVPDLSKCTVKRTLCPDGTLIESVRLDGDLELISREKLEEWVQSFPVKTLEEGRAQLPGKNILNKPGG